MVLVKPSDDFACSDDACKVVEGRELDLESIALSSARDAVLMCRGAELGSGEATLGVTGSGILPDCDIESSYTTLSAPGRDAAETADAAKGTDEVAAETSEPTSRDSRECRFVLSVLPRSGDLSLWLLLSARRCATFLAGRRTRSPTTRGRSSRSRRVELELEAG